MKCNIICMNNTSSDLSCQVCSRKLINRQTKYCSNKCKNKNTNNKFQNYQAQKERGLKRKLKLLSMNGNKCFHCGYSKDYAALTFHHLNPEEKENQLDMRKLSNSTWDWCLSEASKCQVLCFNCHMELHYPNCDFNQLS